MSGELALDTVSSSQSAKEVTVNLIASEIEAALTGQLNVAGGGSVTLLQMQRLAVIIGTGTGDVTITACKRTFGFYNTTGSTMHVKLGTASIAVAAGTVGLFMADGSTNGLYQAGGSGGGSGGLADAPSDGNLYGRESGAWTVVPSGGGGGGGGGGASAPGVKIPLATLFPDKHEASATLTLTNNVDGLIMFGNTFQGGVDIHMASKAPPAGSTWFASIGLKPGGRYGQYSLVGLAITDGTKFISLGIAHSGSYVIVECDRWSSTTAYLDTPHGDNGPSIEQGMGHYRVDYDGTNYTFSYGPSPDCMDVIAVVLNTFMGAVTGVGPFMNCQGAGIGTNMKALIQYYADTDNPR